MRPSALADTKPRQNREEAGPQNDVPHEPNLIPKVRFRLAEFLSQRCSITPESAKLGHLMRIAVRLESVRSGFSREPPRNRLFKAPSERTTFQRKRRNFSVPPPASLRERIPQASPRGQSTLKRKEDSSGCSESGQRFAHHRRRTKRIAPSAGMLTGFPFGGRGLPPESKKSLRKTR